MASMYLLPTFDLHPLTNPLSDPIPLIDNQGRIYAVQAGRPHDPTFLQAATSALETVTGIADGEGFSKAEREHRRGHFPALAIGISYGNGQGIPERLKTGTHGRAVQRLLEDPGIKRLSSYADSAFSLWAPRLYSYYRSHMLAMEERTGEVRNFSNSIFACLTINFGPRVRTFKHRDVLNLPFGWCAIQALGGFDSRKGGHLVLWDLKKIIEFPHASTILVPSATLTHSNTSVGRDEVRISITQYTAGGIFRWVDNGFMTEDQLKERDIDAYMLMCKLKETRWQMGVELFSTMDELLERV